MRQGVVLARVVVLGAIPEDPTIRAGLQLHRLDFPVDNAAPMQRFYLCGFRCVRPTDAPWAWLVGTYMKRDEGLAAYAEHRRKLLGSAGSRDSFWANGRTAVQLLPESAVPEGVGTEMVEMPGYRGVTTYRAPDPVPSPPLWVPKFRTPPAERDEMADVPGGAASRSILQMLRSAGSRWWALQRENEFAPDRSAEPTAMPLPGGVLTWEPARPPSPGVLTWEPTAPSEQYLRDGDTVTVTTTVQFADETPAAPPPVRPRDEEDEEVTFDGYF